MSYRDEMIALHRMGFEWTPNEELIHANFTNFVKDNDDLEPIYLRGQEWQFMQEDF